MAVPAHQPRLRLAPLPLSVEAETGPAALHLLDERWDALLRRQPLPDPCLGSTWLRRLAAVERGTPLVVVARSGDRLVAAAALALRRPGGRLGPVVAGWLGPPEQVLYADALADAEHPDGVAALLPAVFEHADLLHVAAPGSGPVAAALAAAAPWRRAAVLEQRWVVSCPPARHGYARRRAATETRRAERFGARVEVRVHVGGDELDAALVRLFRIHRARWEGRSDASPRFASSAAHRRWNRAAVTELAAAGQVRLAEVVEDDRTLAACLGFVAGRGGVAHTQAMRRDGVMREPGHLAVLRCVEALGEAGAVAVDLQIGGAAPGSPKIRLGAEPQPVLELVAARSPSRQRALGSLRRVALAARRFRRP